LKSYIIHDILDTESYIMYTRRNKGVRTGGFSARAWASFVKNVRKKTAANTHEPALDIRFCAEFTKNVLH